MAFVGKYSVRTGYMTHFSSTYPILTTLDVKSLLQYIVIWKINLIILNIYGTNRRTLKNKSWKETTLKFYKVMAVSVTLYGSETCTFKEEGTNLSLEIKCMICKMLHAFRQNN